ncbi:MAG: V-type ATPase subunit [Acidobacteriota bacterium]
MRRISRLDYIYSVGRVRALEKYLVSQAVFREAAGAASFSAAVKIIYDAGNYPESLIKARSSEELDAVLAAEERALAREFSELCLENDVCATFLLDHDPDNGLRAATRSGYSFLRDFVRHRLDLANIKVFFRAHYLGLSVESLNARLRRGGFIEPRTMVEKFGLDLTEVCQRPEVSPYCEIMIHGEEALRKRETFILLERGIEDFLMNYLRRARLYTFGPEPVYAFALAKKKELALLRLLGLGKMAGLPAELLEERISETYV